LFRLPYAYVCFVGTNVVAFTVGAAIFVVLLMLLLLFFIFQFPWLKNVDKYMHHIDDGILLLMISTIINIESMMPVDADSASHFTLL
jgi:hypothetical protein